jgi:NMD protein affecting ribosome stability and mRNA decay
MNLCPSCGAPNYTSTDVCGMCLRDIKTMQEMILKGHGIPKSRYPVVL